MLDLVKSLEITHTGTVESELRLQDFDEPGGESLFDFEKYVDPGETIEVPFTERVLLSLRQGSLKGYLDQGYVTVELIGDPASTIQYDNSSTPLASANLQDAVDEVVNENLESLSAKIPVRNDTGATIPRGTFVSASGYDASEERILVDEASNVQPQDRPTLGITDEEIPDGLDSDIVVVGAVGGLDTSAFSVGEGVVLGTSGDFVKRPPENDPFEGKIQSVGSVARVSPTDGVLSVSVDGISALEGPELFNTNSSLLRGIESGGALTKGGGRDVGVAAGTGYVTDGTGDLNRIDWDSAVVTIPVDSTRQIYVDENGVQSSIALPDFDETVILGTARANGSEITLLTTHRIPVRRKNARDHNRAIETTGPLTVSGGLATADGLGLDVDASVYYVADNRQTSTSATGASWTYWYRDGSGDWVTTPDITSVNENSWDDGSGSLASIPAGEWKKDLLYVASYDAGTDYHVVYGQQTFGSQSAAESGEIPAAPDELRRFALRSTGLIVQEGGSSIAATTDERPFLGQLAPRGTSTSDHSNLTGLSSDDHPQYLLTDGTRAATGDLDIGGNAITNVNLVDGVDPSDHSARHDPAGDDPLSTDQVVELDDSTNLEGTANSYARSDHQHAHGQRGGGNLHSGATSSTAGFMSAGDKQKVDSNAGVFGQHYAYAESEALSSTTSTTFQVKTQLDVTGVPQADYIVKWTAKVANSYSKGEYQLWDATAGTSLDLAEPELRNNGFESENGFKVLNFSGNRTFQIRYRTLNGGNTQQIRQARIVFWRVG